MNPLRHFFSSIAAAINQILAARIAAFPERQPALPQKILIIELQLFQTGPPTLVSLSSIFFEVPDAWLPSAIFCTPDRAACTI